MKPVNGSTLELLLSHADAAGWGLAEHEGRTYRVSGGLPGETLVARVEASSRHEAVSWARIDRIVEASPERVRPPCHFAWPMEGSCGGCPLMHMTYAASLHRKHEALTQAFRAAGLDAAPSITPAPATEGWRNRTNLLAFASRNGRTQLGSRAPRGHELARMDGCRVVRPAIRDTANSIRRLAQRASVPLAAAGRAGLHGVQVRAGTRDDVLVELIVRDHEEVAEPIAAFAARLAGIPHVVGVVLSPHDGTSNRIRTGPPVPISGRASVRARVAGVPFELDATSFFQLHYEVAERMAHRATEWLGAAPHVVDLYGGTGLLGLAWAAADPSRARHVHLAESNTAAVEAARAAARDVGVPLTALALDLQRPDDLAALADLPADTPILVDPPRAGLSDALLAWLAGRPNAPLVYMSCSPSTFARDAARLIDQGRSLEAVEAHDMLPWTSHVELLGRFAPARAPGTEEVAP